MTDFVSIRDLSVAAVIGVHPWEREIEQTLLVNVDMAADVRAAAASDDLADALDYSAVAATIAAMLREGKFRLIETAADRVAERLLADFPLHWLRLELRKPIASPPAPAATPAPGATLAPGATCVGTAPDPAATPFAAAPASEATSAAATAAGARPAYTAVITIERTSLAEEVSV